MKTILIWLLKLCFRYRACNVESLKTPGPVLLIPNHVSWLDWLFLGVVLEDDWRFVVSRRVANLSWLHRKIMINSRTFPIDNASPYAMKHLAEYLQGNGRLVLFAEGRISATGGLMKLFDGTGFLLFKTRARLITAYLRGANRLKLSRQPGWRRWFPEVTVHFSDVHESPHPEDVSTTEARYDLTDWLRDRMVRQQFEVELEFGPKDIIDGVLRAAAAQPGKVVMEDVKFTCFTYRKLLVATDLFAEKLAPLLPSDRANVGVLLPNANAMPITLLALWALGKTPAVLNFSAGPAVMRTCAELAGMKHVITSRAFLEKAALDIGPLKDHGLEFIYLEDLKATVTTTQKLMTALRLRFSPNSLVRRKPGTNETAVILFTSGSEGMPKGVMLSHRNLMANIAQVLAHTDLTDMERLFNALPLFHSFGLTVGTVLPLVSGMYIFYYPSPLHYRVVTEVFYDRQCTVFMATNTFLNGYARKGHPADFRTCRWMIAGAEKLQDSTRRLYNDKYGVRILEGYGATECGPVVSVNTPLACRVGTTGKILPGIEHRIETVPGVDEGGRLFVRGPNIMSGYLNEDANAKFQELNGWYDTGDIASISDDGYLSILGRLKRFAKVSGEMVSLTAVEEALSGAFPQFGLRCAVAVVAIPDEQKGERLIAVTNEPKITLSDIRNAVTARGLTNLSVPKEIRVVREIPKLGTGKINHRELQNQVAQQQPTAPEEE